MHGAYWVPPELELWFCGWHVCSVSKGTVEKYGLIWPVCPKRWKRHPMYMFSRITNRSLRVLIGFTNTMGASARRAAAAIEEFGLAVQAAAKQERREQERERRERDV